MHAPLDRALQPEAWQISTLLGNLERVKGALKGARAYYEQVERRTRSGDNAYRLACVEAREGNREAALKWLETSLQRGYGDYDTVRGDMELSMLGEDPRFSGLIDRYFTLAR